MFRPQSLEISARGTRASKGAVKFSGTVEHLEFLGHLVRYAVRVGNQVLLVDETHSSGEAANSAGDSVVLSLNQKQVQFLQA